jgi:hypothetical protein
VDEPATGINRTRGCIAAGLVVLAVTVVSLWVLSTSSSHLTQGPEPNCENCLHVVVISTDRHNTLGAILSRGLVVQGHARPFVEMSCDCSDIALLASDRGARFGVTFPA